MSGRPQPVGPRFWEAVNLLTGTDCWEWIGTRTRAGYGRLKVNGASVAAHRVSFELHIGPIPEHLHIDHLCRNRACVNPEHLEAVTQAENNRRAAVVKTHCPQGHPYDFANTRITRDGSRKCRTCHRYERARRKESTP